MPGEPARILPRHGVEQNNLAIFEKIRSQGGDPVASAPVSDASGTRRPEKKLSFFPALLILLRNALQLPEKKPPVSRGTNPMLPAGTGAAVARIPAAIPVTPVTKTPDTLTSLYRATAGMHKMLVTAEAGGLTASFLERLCNELDSIITRLIPLKDPNKLESPAFFDGLLIARNKLRFALALFGMEEVDPLYRLIIRNKVIFKVRMLLGDVLQCWPGVAGQGAYATDPLGQVPGSHLRSEATHQDGVLSWIRDWLQKIARLLAGLDGDRQTHATFRKPAQPPPPQTTPATNPPQQTPPKDDPPSKPPANPPKRK